MRTLKILIIGLLVLVPCLKAEQPLLYVLFAKHATFKPYEGQPRYGSICFKQVGSAFSYFSDAMQAGTISIEDFIVLWKEQASHLRPVPPQITLLDAQGNKTRVELRSPSYNPFNHSFVFEVYAIDPLEPGTLDAVSLWVEQWDRN